MSKRVLVIEDDGDVRWMLADLLGQQGYQVDTALDGKQVVAKLNQPPPDLITLDLNMPIMDGAELIDRIQATPTWSHVPVVIISAAHDAPEWAKKLHASGFLHKPFDPKALSATMERLAPLRDERTLRR